MRKKRQKSNWMHAEEIWSFVLGVHLWEDTFWSLATSWLLPSKVSLELFLLYKNRESEWDTKYDIIIRIQRIYIIGLTSAQWQRIRILLEGSRLSLVLLCRIAKSNSSGEIRSSSILPDFCVGLAKSSPQICRLGQVHLVGYVVILFDDIVVITSSLVPSSAIFQ